MHQLVVEIWRRHQMAILLVTHDVDEAIALADRLLVLDGGRVAHGRRHPASRRAQPREPGDRPDPRSRADRARRQGDSPTRTVSPDPAKEQHEHPHLPLKKLAALVTALVAALLLAACGGAATGNEAAVNDDGEVDLSKVTLIVGDQKGG